MAKDRKPPLKDQTDNTTLPEDLKNFLIELTTEIKQNDIDAVEDWRRKMRIARNMRQGIKRITDYPYEGAPDIPLPEVDKIIKKAKPRYVLAAISGKNFMKITPMEGIQEVTDQMKQSAKKATLAMNYLFRLPQMNWVKKLTLASDYVLEKGHCIFKTADKYYSRIVNKVIDVTELPEEDLQAFKAAPAEQKKLIIADKYGLDPEIDRDRKQIDRALKEFNSGKKKISVQTEEVYNLPDVLVPSPEKVFVPKGTTDISKTDRVTNEYYLSENELMQLAMDGIFDKAKVLDAIETHNTWAKKGDDSDNEKMKDELEGVDDSEKGSVKYKMHETITWRQVSKDSHFERWLFVMFADVGDCEKALVMQVPYPFEFDGWNYVKHDHETMDERYYSSRGTPEQLRAIQEFQEKAMNNMLIRDELNNAPMFTVLDSSDLASDAVKFIPGQKLVVSAHDELQEINRNTSVDMSSERILQTLKAYAEEYAGLSDQLFRNATNKGGGKTLGEIQIGVTETQFSANLDIQLWLESLRKVYEQIFNIFRERLVKPLVINGTVVTRDDFAFIPDITVNGSLEMADKALQAQRSQVRLGMARQAKMDGVATLDDVFNAYTDYFEKDGVKEPNDFVTDPKIVLQQKITQLEQQMMQMQQMLQGTQSEIAQNQNTLKQIETQIRKKSAELKGTAEGSSRARR